MKLILLVLLAFSLSSHSAITLKPIKKELGIVWAMEFLSDSKIIFTERSGKIKILDLSSKKVIEVSGAPRVYARGQGGLLDIKKHPLFEKNKRIYLTYSKSLGKNRTTALGFGTLKDNKLINFKEIFVGKGESSKRIHFGSRIAFETETTLFFTIGDRGQRPNAQNLENHFGKVHRINDDGTIPKDNPFVNQKKAMPEIWSYGHRNPQGLYYDSKTKTLYEMEHGPRGGDEINIIKKGLNYGWPEQSYGKEYTWFSDVGKKVVKGMEQPLKFYDPSIAPSDLVLYEGEKFKSLKGSLLAGALALTHLNAFNPQSKQEQRLFEKRDERVRSLLVSPKGDIFIATDVGTIYQCVSK